MIFGPHANVCFVQIAWGFIMNKLTYVFEITQFFLRSQWTTAATFRITKDYIFDDMVTEKAIFKRKTKCVLDIELCWKFHLKSASSNI